jgi:hypothetical protein
MRDKRRKGFSRTHCSAKALLLNNLPFSAAALPKTFFLKPLKQCQRSSGKKLGLPESFTPLKNFQRAYSFFAASAKFPETLWKIGRSLSGTLEPIAVLRSLPRH